MKTASCLGTPSSPKDDVNGENLASITGDANAMSSSDVCELSLCVGSSSRLLDAACMYFTRYRCIDTLYGRYEYPIPPIVPTVSHDAYRLVRMEGPGKLNGSSAAKWNVDMYMYVDEVPDQQFSTAIVQTVIIGR